MVITGTFAVIFFSFSKAHEYKRRALYASMRQKVSIACKLRNRRN
ncbi:hypothetical protein CSC18_3442 [Klebsiella aerogenes]|nr:hypothetical protein CSC18_3442 [Klebsiella aerogenes]